MLATGTLLAQVRPSTTNTATTLFTATLGVEITRIIACNPPEPGGRAQARNFTLHHVVRGGTAGNGNVLRYEEEIGTTETLDLGQESGTTGIQMQAGDSLIVKVSLANTITFTVYGVTERLAERQTVRQPT